jgi:hypothetical protein
MTAFCSDGVELQVTRSTVSGITTGNSATQGRKRRLETEFTQSRGGSAERNQLHQWSEDRYVILAPSVRLRYGTDIPGFKSSHRQDSSPAQKVDKGSVRVKAVDA